MLNIQVCWNNNTHFWRQIHLLWQKSISVNKMNKIQFLSLIGSAKVSATKVAKYRFFIEQFRFRCHTFKFLIQCFLVFPQKYKQFFLSSWLSLRFHDADCMMQPWRTIFDVINFWWNVFVSNRKRFHNTNGNRGCLCSFELTHSETSGEKLYCEKLSNLVKSGSDCEKTFFLHKMSISSSEVSTIRSQFVVVVSREHCSIWEEVVSLYLPKTRSASRMKVSRVKHGSDCFKAKCYSLYEEGTKEWWKKELKLAVLFVGAALPSEKVQKSKLAAII